MSEYQHYVRPDTAGIVIHGFSTAFEVPTTVDVCIDESAGRHFTKPLRTDRGQARYKLVKGALTDRSQAELDAEWAARPAPLETDSEKIARLEAERAELAAQFATLNQNFTDFMELYFAGGPQT